MKATLIDADGTTLEVDDVSEACESVTRAVRRSVPVTKEDLDEAFRFRSVEEILSGPRKVPGVEHDHVMYLRDWSAPGLVFRRARSLGHPGACVPFGVGPRHCSNGTKGCPK